MKSQPTRIYGLTGGIASGKSTVARLFAEHGIPVLDADSLARELSAPGGLALEAILRRFGTADRERLREMVFADAAARKDLEAILHPLIRSESAKRLKAMSGPYALYEAALIVEAGRAKEFDGLIVVTAERETRKSRLIARNGFSAEQAERILSTQSDDATKLAQATHVIRNDGTLEQLQAAVSELRTRLLP